MAKDREVILYGAEWCADCHRVKRIFDTEKIAYKYVDTDKKALLDEMLSLTGGANIIPTLVVDSKIIQNPSNADLIKTFDIQKDKLQTHDLVVVGAGPAALAASIYTTREDLDTVLYEKGVIGGLAAITDWVDNYPGFAKGISGLDLADALREQAERFGAKIELGEVMGIFDETKYLRVNTTDGDVYARAVLIATGSDYKKLGIPGEKEYYGRGVHYCATCDGAFYRDQRLVVVGGGNSAVQEAIFLTRFSKNIDLLVRGPHLRASEVLQHELEKLKDIIKVHYNTRTDEIVGTDGKVTKVVGYDKISAKKVEFPTDGVFVFIGLLPNTGFLKNSKIELDEFGFVKTDYNLQTTLRGVYCAGDVRSGATMQIASASGEGATAALMIRKYLEERAREN